MMSDQTAQSAGKIAIYLREDVQIPGDLERQRQICREYCALHFGKAAAEAAVPYVEDGPPGQLIRRDSLLSEIQTDPFRAVVCARLDRICLGVAELSDLLERFSERSVIFVAVEERISTAAPLGRALDYLAGLMKGLERKGSSERVRDNMLELAKTGRWLGGVTPTGYTSKKLPRGGRSPGGRSPSAHASNEYVLEIKAKEAETVNLIFSSFLTHNSLAKVERELQQKKVKSKNGRSYSRFTIRQLLENPVYMLADDDAFRYFSEAGSELFSTREEFDGVHGMMVYNKTVQQGGKAGKSRDISQWIVAVGKHKGIIPGSQWVGAQQLLEQNKSPDFRKPRSAHALLPGILRCGQCGAYMRPKQTSRVTADGEPVFIYLCERKEQSKSSLCQMKNVGGNQLDQVVCDELRRLSADSAGITELLERSGSDALPKETPSEIPALEARLEEVQQSISGLVKGLIKTVDKAAYDYIIRQIDELHTENTALQSRLDELSLLTGEHALAGDQVEIAREILQNFQEGFESMDVEQKRAALRALVEKVVWDGARVQVFLFGAASEKLNPAEN